MDFHVEDMTCGGCVGSITRAIQRIDPQAKVTADQGTRLVSVESRRSEDEIAEAITKAGFAGRAA